MIATARDLRMRDQLAEASAATVARLGPPLKALAQRIGTSDRQARRWAKEGRGCPLFPATVLTYEVARLRRGQPFEIIAHLKSIAYQGMMSDMRDATLVERFWTLQREESVAQGQADVHQTTVGQDGDLEGLEQACLAHAARLEALAAVCAELRRRGIDPRPRGQA